jgi:hypothetical protein
MIREIVIKPENRYGRFFLSTEAPGDDEPPKKSNTKVIEVRPNNRKRYDFSSNAADPEDIEASAEEVPTEEPTETPQEDNAITDTGEDFTANADETNPMDDTPADATAPVVNDPENPGTGTEADVDTGDDFTADAGEDETTLDTDDTGEGDIDTGDDFTADAGTDAPTDGGDAGATPAADGQKKGPGIEYDSTRKYSLFLNYESLINACNNYVSKLENNIGDNMNVNKVIKTGAEKLREVKELAYDYITMKFEASSYIQSLLFYQNLIIIVQGIFDMLKKSLAMVKTDK